MIAWNPFPIDPIHDLNNGMPVCVWKRTIPSFEIMINTFFYLLGILTDSGLMPVKHLMDKVIPVLMAQGVIDFFILGMGR